MFLERVDISDIVCSAAEIVFPSGRFITTTPWLVAASISILSTPTPALPITNSEVESIIFFLVILVPLLIIHA